MPRYMIIASNTAEGIKGVLKDGGSARREALTNRITAMGGSVDSFDFGFGADDIYVVCELPNNVTAATLALVAKSTGLANFRTIVLMSPEEIDAAAAQAAG